VPRKMIGEFLVELTEDPSQLAEYQRDQRGFLAKRSDLSEDQKAALLSNDLKRIRDVVRDEYKKADVIVVPMPAQHVA
jgi:hypothetical protein